MKRIIYSLYIDIPKEDLDWQPPYHNEEIPKTQVTKNEFIKHYDWLKQKQMQYASAIEVEYKLFEYDEEYKKFKSYMNSNYSQVTEYCMVNFYKLHLLYQLTKDYDEILYLDFDVVPVTKENFFEAWDVTNKGLVIYRNTKEIDKTIPTLKKDKFKHGNRGYAHSNRSPTAKYWNSRAMLTASGYSGENDVYNTGIVGISKEQCEQLGYWDNFNNTIELMDELKNEEDSMFPEFIQSMFGYDNETIWSYKTKINKVENQWLTEDWHHFMDKWDYIPRDTKFIHVINKHFDYVRGWCEKNNF